MSQPELPENELVEIQRVSGPKKESSYIVFLKPNVDRAGHIRWLQTRLSSGSKIDAEIKALNGYVGTFEDTTLRHIRGSRDVERIEEDAHGVLSGTHKQGPAPWGLNRMSQVPTLKDKNPYSTSFQYTYDDSATQTVDIYIIDTGINVAHREFNNNRATWGWVMEGLPKEDTNGHGTQVAGVAGGNYSGAYKHANLIAIKATDGKTVTVSGVIQGLDYVYQAAQYSGRRSIANLSLGFPDPDRKIISIDTMVGECVKKGIHVCVAAGNDNIDAGTITPARAPSVNTIGASNINDARYADSNYGSVVKLFAPGECVYAPTIGGTGQTVYVNGTSFASPYVAGLIAYYISIFGWKDPSAMSTYLISQAVDNALSGIPKGTPNLLVNNGFF